MTGILGRLVLIAVGLVAVANGQSCDETSQTVAVSTHAQRDRLDGVRQAARVLIRWEQ